MMMFPLYVPSIITFHVFLFSLLIKQLNFKVEKKYIEKIVISREKSGMEHKKLGKRFLFMTIQKLDQGKSREKLLGIHGV